MLGLWHSWDESLPISGFGRFSKGAEVLAHPNRPDNGSHQKRTRPLLEPHMPTLLENQQALTGAGFALSDFKSIAGADGSLKFTGLDGFEVVETGGGCLAMRRNAGEFYMLLTSECGSDVPDEQDWEENLIGIYREDDDSEVMCMSARDLLDLINKDTKPIDIESLDS